MQYLRTMVSTIAKGYQLRGQILITNSREKHYDIHLIKENFSPINTP